MSYLKRCGGRVLTGTLFFLLFAALPALVIHLTDSGIWLFGAWMLQMVVATVLLVLLRHRFRRWIWLLVIAATSILGGPILGTQWPYLSLGIMGTPCPGTAAEFKASPNRCGFAAYPVVEGLRADPSSLAELELEDHWVERDPENGREIEHSSSESFNFASLWGPEGAVDPIWALLEWNQDNRSRAKALSSGRSPLFLIPGPPSLADQARMVYRHPDRRGAGGELASEFLAALAAFPNEAGLQQRVRERCRSVAFGMLGLWALFVLLPALVMARRKQS